MGSRNWSYAPHIPFHLEKTTTGFRFKPTHSICARLPLNNNLLQASCVHIQYIYTAFVYTCEGSFLQMVFPRSASIGYNIVACRKHCGCMSASYQITSHGKRLFHQNTSPCCWPDQLGVWTGWYDVWYEFIELFSSFSSLTPVRVGCSKILVIQFLLDIHFILI